MKSAFLIVSIFLLLTGCTKGSSVVSHAGKTPEEVVKMFIEASAGSKQADDRRHLQDLCSGEMRRTFERMNEEAFRMIYLDAKVSVVELKFAEAKVTGDTAKIAYQLTVDNKQGTDPTREVNSREVDLTRVNGAWFIDNIRMRGTDQVAFTRGMLF